MLTFESLGRFVEANFPETKCRVCCPQIWIFSAVCGVYFSQQLTCFFLWVDRYPFFGGSTRLPSVPPETHSGDTRALEASGPPTLEMRSSEHPTSELVSCGKFPMELSHGVCEPSHLPRSPWVIVIPGFP